MPRRGSLLGDSVGFLLSLLARPLGRPIPLHVLPLLYSGARSGHTEYPVGKPLLRGSIKLSNDILPALVPLLAGSQSDLCVRCRAQRYGVRAKHPIPIDLTTM